MPTFTRVTEVMRQYSVLLIVVCALHCRGEGQDFYRGFLRVLNTNAVWGYAITSPLLVDTNNTALKLTNAILDFKRIMERGEIAGVRLGMSMDEVVNRLGKPPFFWSANRGGGPCFEYTDFGAVFEPDSDRVWRIFVPYSSLQAIRFEKGLSVRSTPRDWVHAIGKPTSRGEWRGQGAVYLAYAASEVTSLIIFDSEKQTLRSIRLERPQGLGNDD